MNFKDFQEKFGDKAGEVFAAVCQIGGFGTVPQSHEGGLDLAGLPAETRRKVDEILNPNKKAVKTKDEEGDN